MISVKLLKYVYGSFNIEMVGRKVSMTSNMISYSYFLLVFEFKPNFTDEYSIKNITNQD